MHLKIEEQCDALKRPDRVQVGAFLQECELSDKTQNLRT